MEAVLYMNTFKGEKLTKYLFSLQNCALFWSYTKLKFLKFVSTENINQK